MTDSPLEPVFHRLPLSLIEGEGRGVGAGTLLHAVVRERLEPFLAAARDRSATDRGLAAHVERDLRAYLGCGRRRRWTPSRRSRPGRWGGWSHVQGTTLYGFGVRRNEGNLAFDAFTHVFPVAVMDLLVADLDGDGGRDALIADRRARLLDR